MNITKSQVKALGPCSDGYSWYLGNCRKEDLHETLLTIYNFRPDWALWLFLNLMGVNQKRRLAIFAASQVLHLYENKYPGDHRPRKAIEAAQAVIDSDTLANGITAAAYADAAAAGAAADASDAAAAYAGDAAAYAAYAAYAGATRAASSGDYANYAVDAAYSRTTKEIDKTIIEEAVRILDEK
jgi:hypothetical protein